MANDNIDNLNFKVILDDADFDAQIDRDIELAKKHFEYFSVNVFCNNGTHTKRDKELVAWFVKEVYPTLKDQPRIEVLLDNTDLGVGEL